MTVAHARAAVRPKITDEDLMRLPRDGRKWELVDGEIKEVPTSYTHDQIVIRLEGKVFAGAPLRDLNVSSPGAEP